MSKPLLGNKVVTQIGIIVKDIEKTAQKFADFFGEEIPPIIVTDGYDKTKAEYKGKPSEAKAKLAFFHAGDLDIELIEPDEQPSTWREFLEKNGEGVHHIAFEIKDMQDKVNKLEELGMPLEQKGEYSGGRYAYFNCNKDLKVMLELLEND